MLLNYKINISEKRNYSFLLVFDLFCDEFQRYIRLILFPMKSKDVQKEIISKIQGINSMIYSTMLGFGIEYGISKKVTVNLEPLFKYSLNSINKDSEYIYKPYSIGVFTGINYKL